MVDHKDSDATQRHQGGCMRGPIGHVYVIKFADGLVKAGRTSSPQKRIRSGSYGGRAIVDLWVSEKMAHSIYMEKNVLSAIDAMATSKINLEYFGGVDFQAAVEAAKRECEKAKEMFCPDAIEHEKKRSAAAADELIKLSFGLIENRSSQDNESKRKAHDGLVAIQNAVFYSSLGIRELLNVVAGEVCHLDVSNDDSERADRVLDLVEGCRSALDLIARVMTAEFTGDEISEIYDYSIQSKVMLESIRTLSGDEFKQSMSDNSNGGERA